eukprot:773084-Rhodomonas_salina.2
MVWTWREEHSVTATGEHAHSSGGVMHLVGKSVSLSTSRMPRSDLDTRSRSQWAVQPETKAAELHRTRKMQQLEA